MNFANSLSLLNMILAIIQVRSGSQEDNKSHWAQESNLHTTLCR